MNDAGCCAPDPGWPAVVVIKAWVLRGASLSDVRLTIEPDLRRVGHCRSLVRDHSFVLNSGLGCLITSRSAGISQAELGTRLLWGCRTVLEPPRQCVSGWDVPRFV